MLTITFLFVIVAFLLTIGSAMGKVPVWVPVLLLAIVHLLQLLPVR